MNDADELLSRCLKGLTQYQNESVNGFLWNLKGIKLTLELTLLVLLVLTIKMLHLSTNIYLMVLFHR